MGVRTRPEAGIGKLTLLVFGSVVGAALFAAFRLVPIFYSYYELRSQMQEITKIASEESDEVIRERLGYHMKKLDVPVDPSDIVIERGGGKIRLRLVYTEVFSVPWRGKEYDVHTFRFDAKAERRL